MDLNPIMDLSRLSLQDLPSRAAHICLQAERFVSRELGVQLQGGRLLLSLSAGLDSTALAVFCKALEPRWNSRLYAAHLDHCLRPESGQEANEVRKLCSSLDIPCKLGRSQAAAYARARGLGLEEAGRVLRYRFLQAWSRKLQADWILTAHHLNDLAEDILLRQLRGAGWPALAGMSALEAEQSLLRPFLLLPKAKLQELVGSLGLSWQEDPSNQDQGYTRNRIRQNILPLLLKENPNYLQTCAQLWRQGRLDQDFWTQELQRLRFLELKTSQGVLLPDAELCRLHPALRLRWYRDALQRLGCRQTLARNLWDLDLAWQEKSRAKTLQFPGNRQARTSRQGIEFF
ncbi:MAG: tRNA lysidine(34) synthetase TilS [Desulfohalobiaceae bacterium]